MSTFLQKSLLPLLILFHAIGLVGMSFIDTAMFASLSMYHLLFSLLLLFLAQVRGKASFLKLFLPVFLLGYFIEVVGVATGFPFGEYHYGAALGLGAWGVPLVIGINWYMLTLGAGYWARQWPLPIWGKVLVGALLMVAIDYPIEQVAPMLDYWHWEGGNIPVQNFVGWFIIAAIMQWMFVKLMTGTRNILARPYLIVVVVFFILLNLFL